MALIALALAATLLAAACGGGGAKSTPAPVSPTSATAATSPVLPTVAPIPTPAAPPPPFIGTLNGIAIDPTKDTGNGFDACPGTGLTTPSSVPEIESLVFGTGPLRIDPARLPAGATRINAPDVFLCKGEVFSAAAYFILAPGTANVNPGGGGLDITRLSRFDYVRFSAPASSWSATTIGGQPAVTALVTLPTGAISCFTAVVDHSTGHATFVFAHAAANKSVCESVAEGQLRTSLSDARIRYLSSGSLARLDAALTMASADGVLSLWKQHTALCFVGSEKTGGLCEGLDGPTGTEHNVDVVTFQTYDERRTTAQAAAILHELLDFNPATLVMVARVPESGHLLLAYEFGPRGGAFPSLMRPFQYIYLEADPGAPQPVAILGVSDAGNSPVAMLHSGYLGGSLGGLIAGDQAMIDDETRRDP